jgi:BTB/POZ domain
MDNTSTSSTPSVKCQGTIVKFNVGGKRFDVSRSLINAFPHTMLSKVASETWQKADDDPIFIDRDCERFHYVLDYMRDGYTSIPFNITRDAVLNELSYFGFENVDPETITVQHSPSSAVNLVASYYHKHPLMIQSLNLAFKRFDHYIKTSAVYFDLSKSEYAPYGNFITHNYEGDFKKSTGPSKAYRENSLLQKCCREFGIEYISIYTNVHCIIYSIKFGFLNEPRHFFFEACSTIVTGLGFSYQNHRITIIFAGCLQVNLPLYSISLCQIVILHVSCMDALCCWPK